MKSSITAGMLIAAGLALNAPAARADFCVEITTTPPTFFRFKAKYSTKVEKITPLNGYAIPFNSMTRLPQGFAPAFGQMLGLHEGDAGNTIAVTFTRSNEVGHMKVTLDDNGFSTGGGRIFFPSGAADVGAQLVDCDTEPPKP